MNFEKRVGSSREEAGVSSRHPYSAGPTRLASHAGFFEATLSSIPDFVYAFDRRHRFIYANPAMLELLGRSFEQVIGKTFTDLNYPADLADRLDGHIDRIVRSGATVEDEVSFRSPQGEDAYFAFLWGPVHGPNGSVASVVGVSRKTSARRAVEERLRRNEARLRAATELVGLGIYSWIPGTGALDWDDRVRAMWGLPPGAPVDMEVYEAGIHPDDLARVRSAIAACLDPKGDGGYAVEYRVIGRDDGRTRHIATSGRTRFEHGRAVGFIGAAIDVTAQRRAEAAVRRSEAQFRSFADHSSHLIWIADPALGKITYRSAAFERIWGVPSEDSPVALVEWVKTVHPDDRGRVERALASVGTGEVAHFEYRIVRPADGAIRCLRDTSFPIRDEHGTVTQIGGITEDLTQDDTRQVYVVSAMADEAAFGRPRAERRLSHPVFRQCPRVSRHGSSPGARLRARRPPKGKAGGAVGRPRTQGALDHAAHHRARRPRCRRDLRRGGDEGRRDRLHHPVG